jgi:hypothetical protein
LDGIGDSIEHSHQELESFQALARIEQSAIQSETVLCEAKLHSLQEDMPRRLAEMQPNLARLEDLAKRRANQLNFPLVVAEARRNALDLLDELASCGQRGSPSGGSIAPNQLDDMRARYTMANEQRVHENALHALNQKEGMKQTEVLPVHTSGSIASFTTRPKTQQPAEAIKLEAHSDHLPGGDLGDNIELF